MLKIQLLHVIKSMFNLNISRKRDSDGLSQNSGSFKGDTHTHTHTNTPQSIVISYPISYGHFVDLGYQQCSLEISNQINIY